MALSLSGLSTGIDTSTLVAALMQAESVPLTRLQNQKTLWQQRDAAVSEIQVKLETFQDMLDKLRDAADLRAVNATTSDDDVLSVTASGAAAEGTHSLVVNRLASAQRQVHAGAAQTTTLVGAGAFNYTYNGVTRNIVTTAETTLENLRDLINNDGANPGLTAGLLQYDAGDGLAWHLVLGGRNTGDDYAITVNDAATTLDGTNGTIDFRTAAFSVTQQAQDAQFRVDGYPADPGWIESDTNTLADVLEGLTIELHATGSATVGVTADDQDVKDRMTDMVAAYNQVVDKIREHTGYDAATKKSGILQGDQALRGLMTQVRQAMLQGAGFSGDDAYGLAAQIGLEFASDGKATLDSTQLDEALADNYDQVLLLIGAANAGASDDDYIQFAQADDQTAAGLYDVEVTFVAGAVSSARIRLEGGDWLDATVAGGLISGPDGSDAEGLRLTAVWDGASATQTAQVRVRRGLAGEAYNQVQAILDSDSGRLPGIRDRISSSMELVDKKIEFQQARLEKVEKTLRDKFARLEQALTQMQAIMSSLQSMATQSS